MRGAECVVHFVTRVRWPINVIRVALKVEIELGSFGNSCLCPDNLFAPTDRYCSPFTRTSGEMYADPADPSCPFRLHYGCTLYGAAEMNMYFLASSPRESTEICKDRPEQRVALSRRPFLYNLFPRFSRIITIPRPRGLVLRMIKTHLFMQSFCRRKKNHDGTFLTPLFFYIFQSSLS